MNIPFAKPLIGEEEITAVSDVLRSGWVTQGPQTTAFENDFAEYVGADYACAVSNCTTALHLALLAVGISPGDEVITVSSSFIATANSVLYCGAVPVFVDIDPATFNIDSSKVEKCISTKTKAILCVHQVGMPCDLKTITEIAQRHSLKVVEDAACAVGSKILWSGKWEKIGKPHGDIACFSFHPRKLLTTGEGGMITTNDKEINDQLHLLKQHATTANDMQRHGSKKVTFESHPILGYNYRMTDMQAAMGRQQLKKIPAIVVERQKQAKLYHELLSEIPGVITQKEPEWAKSNWQSYWIRLPLECDQTKVMQKMLDDGVNTRRGVMCAHEEEVYSKYAWHCGHDTGDAPFEKKARFLENSEIMQKNAIILPLYPGMTEEEQRYVVKSLKKACEY